MNGMKHATALAACLVLIASDAAAAQPRGARPPARVGSCATTTIRWIGTRLQDENERPIPGTGSAVELANGVYGVSYGRVRAVERSRVGDRVRTCLVSIPRGCPPGDERGREYRTTNLRTRQSWTLPDAAHGCGGA